MQTVKPIVSKVPDEGPGSRKNHICFLTEKLIFFGCVVPTLNRFPYIIFSIFVLRIKLKF